MNCCKPNQVMITNGQLVQLEAVVPSPDIEPLVDNIIHGDLDNQIKHVNDSIRKYQVAQLPWCKNEDDKTH